MPYSFRMKYFTRSMWEAAAENHTAWVQAFQDYREQLTILRSRLDEEAFAFFDEAEVHDVELLHMRIVDGSRPAPLSAPARSWEAPMNYPVRAQLSVLDAWDRFVWQLTYSGVRRAVVDFPGEETLFYQPGEGFGDWGYHELTDAGNGFLRHEILFSSGSILAVEFREVVVVKALARVDSGPGGDDYAPSARCPQVFSLSTARSRLATISASPGCSIQTPTTSCSAFVSGFTSMAGSPSRIAFATCTGLRPDF